MSLIQMQTNPTSYGASDIQNHWYQLQTFFKELKLDILLHGVNSALRSSFNPIKQQNNFFYMAFHSPSLGQQREDHLIEDQTGRPKTSLRFFQTLSFMAILSITEPFHLVRNFCSQEQVQENGFRKEEVIASSSPQSLIQNLLQRYSFSSMQDYCKPPSLDTSTAQLVCISSSVLNWNQAYQNNPITKTQKCRRLDNF